ncbi:MAG: hypothetical protein RDU59_03325 [Thermodesulfobacteriota bacterium]|nr:hypothetical protein [Thermodesulfobacteriota bacterium]
MRRKYEAIKTLASALVFFLIFATAIGYGFAEVKTGNAKEFTQAGSQNITQVKWLIFTDTGFSYERNLVIKLNAKDIKESKLVGEDEVEIFIALEDLNGDHDNEIFAYFVHPYFCGAKGNCSFKIYMNIKGKLKEIGPPIVPYIPIDEKGQQDIAGVLNSKKLGWNDIIIGKFIYEWNGNKYKAVMQNDSVK